MLRLPAFGTWALAATLLASGGTAVAQDASAKSLVQTVVNNELAKDQHDRTHWMYRDAKKTPEKDTVKLVIETGQGNLFKTLKVNGHAPNDEDREADQEHREKMLNDPSERQKQARDRHEDGEKARAMMKMLPEAFNWTKKSENGNEITLAFSPNPNFTPDTREAEVFAAMAGTMTVDKGAMRLKRLTGALTEDVNFGWGILGKLRKGGTFDVQRAEVAPGEWQMVETHVHINGRALLFKSIDQNEDETFNDYRRMPDSLTLTEAAQMLDRGPDKTADAANSKHQSGEQARQNGSSAMAAASGRH
ncbi:MAG TPA: hypothetical protein VGC88_12635 [Terriglobales bacterium]|jgi:hypothetical protein